MVLGIHDHSDCCVGPRMCERSRLIFVGQASEEVGMPLCVLKSRRDLRARPWQLDGSSLPCTVLSKAHYNCGWQVACYMEQHRLDLERVVSGHYASRRACRDQPRVTLWLRRHSPPYDIAGLVHDEPCNNRTVRQAARVGTEVVR